MLRTNPLREVFLVGLAIAAVFGTASVLCTWFVELPETNVCQADEPALNGPRGADWEEARVELLNERITGLDKRLDAQEGLFQATILRFERVGYLVLFLFTAGSLVIGLLGLRLLQIWMNAAVQATIEKSIEQCVHKVVDPILEKHQRLLDQTRNELMQTLRAALEEGFHSLRMGGRP